WWAIKVTISKFYMSPFLIKPVSQITEKNGSSGPDELQFCEPVRDSSVDGTLRLSALGTADCGEYREAAGIVRPKRLDCYTDGRGRRICSEAKGDRRRFLRHGLRAGEVVISASRCP